MGNQATNSEYKYCLGQKMIPICLQLNYGEVEVDSLQQTQLQQTQLT